MDYLYSTAAGVFSSLDAKDVLLWLLGLAVSLLTFWLGYRKTIGARQERARQANTELERLVLRSILLDQNRLSADDIQAIRRAKASDFQVSLAQLSDTSLLLDIIFLRVSENDYIETKAKRAAVRHIRQVTSSDRVELRAKRERYKTIVNRGEFFLALISVIAGTVAFAAASTISTTKSSLAAVLVAVALMTVVTVFVA
jgi:hypothetical protein